MRASQSFLRTVLAVAVAASASSFLVSASLSPAKAAVYSPQLALPPATIQQFLANPSALLTKYPNGGAQMIAEVRDLLGSDPQTLNALLTLLGTANPDQASAIGTGLGQVAQMAVSSDPAFATQIQTALVATGNTSAMVAFDAVVGGNIKLTAATAGAGAGAGGGGESQTGATSPAGGFFAGTPIGFTTFAHNTPDSFPTLTFTGTPATPSVSRTTP